MSDINNQDYNPLLEINTSFESYLKARTRTYTDHVVGGRMDYAFDGDFAMRSKLNTMNGWNKLYKSITLTEIPNHYKKLFRTADIATSMLFANAYNAANKCSERMHLVPPQVMVKKAKGVPEIYSFSCDGVETSIVISSDIAEMCTEKELCYLIGCELGRIQNQHTVYNFAFSALGLTDNDEEENTKDSEDGSRQLGYTLNSWLCAADFTADRAGIICLDDPSDFAETYISVRKKCIPDSFKKIDPDIDKSAVMEKFAKVHATPIRDLSLDAETSQDERRIFAGIEFTGCEVLYNWRPDLNSSGMHLTGKQTLEIRCEILAGADRQSV